MSKAVEAWAFYRGVLLDFMRPGKPTDNGYIESFVVRVLDVRLKLYQFLSLTDAKTEIEAWRENRNHRRPHRSRGPLTLNEFA